MIRLNLWESRIMVSLSELKAEINSYASAHSLSLWISEVYDLFPEGGSTSNSVLHAWPEKWPNGSSQGIYLFLDPTFLLLYVGKSSGKSSSIRSRLNGYFDSAAKRGSGQCILREEWNGYHRPWGTRPRFVVTVAMEPDSETGACLASERLEKYLIQKFSPSENTSLKLRSSSV